jgi:hypothetical protein
MLHTLSLSPGNSGVLWSAPGGVTHCAAAHHARAQAHNALLSASRLLVCTDRLRALRMAQDDVKTALVRCRSLYDAPPKAEAGKARVVAAALEALAKLIADVTPWVGRSEVEFAKFEVRVRHRRGLSTKMPRRECPHAV